MVTQVKQNCRMIPMKERLLLRPQLSGVPALILHHTVFILFLTCAGESSQPIVAMMGDDIVLPCQMEHAVDASGLTVEWSRPDLEPRFVHLRRDSVELVLEKNPLYKGRTSLSTNRLKRGDISLKLSTVKVSDEGTYRGFVPTSGTPTDCVIQLTVGSVSFPDIKISKVSNGVLLVCKSEGWYPEPEVFWLDGEGNLLSAGPTETVRGPDDLYTVSSRVTVEKRHSNSFTSRVQQNSTNQTRETKIHVPDDFFEVQSSSSSTTVGLAVSLAVCILVILILGFFVWKLKTKRSSKRPKTRVDGVTEEQQEGQQLMTRNKGREERKTENSKWPLVTRKRFKEEENMLKEEKKRREEAEEEVQRKNQELQEKTDQMERSKDETIRKLQQKTQDKEKEWENKVKEEEKKRERAEERVKKMEEHPDETIRKLQQEKQDKNKEWENKFKEEEKKRGKAVKELQTELQEEKQRREEEVQRKNQELQEKTDQMERSKDETIRKLQQETQDKEKALKDQLESKHKELDGLKDEVNKLTEEKKTSEEERQKLQTNITQWENKFKEEEKKRERAEEEVEKLREVQGES